MKQTIFLIAIIALLFACKTPMKMANTTSENVTVEESRNQTNVTETFTFVDTSKKSGVEINYFKVEFYPSGLDTVNKSLTNRDRGTIKSVEKYTIINTTEKTGISSTKENNTMNTSTEYIEEVSRQEEITEQPAPDPFRWRYMFGIMVTIVLLAAGVYFGLRKSKIITSVVTFFKRIL
jgi:hypothetical protein